MRKATGPYILVVHYSSCIKGDKITMICQRKTVINFSGRASQLRLTGKATGIGCQERDLGVEKSRNSLTTLMLVSTRTIRRATFMIMQKGPTSTFEVKNRVFHENRLTDASCGVCNFVPGSDLAAFDKEDFQAIHPNACRAMVVRYKLDKGSQGF